MIVIEDSYFIFSCSFLVYFISMGVVQGIALMTTEIYKSLVLYESTISSREGSQGGVMSFLDNIIRQIISLMVASIVYVFRLIVTLYPFFLVLLIFSVLHENQSEVALMIKTAYNEFLVQTKFVSWLHTSSWFMKLAFEFILPLWNFLVSTFRLVLYNVGGLFFEDEHGGENLQKVLQALGQTLFGFSTGIYKWTNTQLDCRFDQWQHDVLQSSAYIPCLDYTHRTLDLRLGIAGLQQTTTSVVQLAHSACPVGAGVVAVLIYPLSDPLLTEALNSALNALIQIMWDIADVTQLRCRTAIKTQSSLVFCVPDVAPFFHMWSDAVYKLGLVLDNWLQEANDAVLKLFMYKDVVSGQDVLLYDEYAIQKWFQQKDFTLTRLGATLIAYTDGRSVLLQDRFGSGDRQFPQVFDPAVDVTYGLAPVAFAKTADDLDFNGADATSLMGCRCQDSSQGLKISCSVARFSRTLGNDNIDGVAATIDVQFDTRETVQYLSCQTVQISVQPVRYPQISSEEQEGRMETRDTNECLIDPRKCNNVDALVYVKPLCLRSKSVQEQSTPAIARAINRNRAACIQGFQYSSCYPYCVGLRFRYSGASRITLYGKNAMDGGIWKSYTKCSEESIASISAIIETGTMFKSEPDTMKLRDSFSDNAAQVACNMNVDSSTFQLESASNGTANAILPEFRNFEFDWVQHQPFAFAGDSLLVPTCDIVDGRCSYTATLHRFTSTLLGQYQLRSIVTRIPAGLTSSELQENMQGRANKVWLPFMTQDIFASRNLAAQTASGIFYAVNPDLSLFREQYLARCSDNEIPALEFFDAGLFRESRLFFTRPRIECMRGTLQGAAGVWYDGTQARSCTSNLTREVFFEGSDAFLKAEHLSSSISCRHVSVNQNCNVKHNLFISHVSTFDDLNILVVVRHGLASFMEFELGVREPNASCYGGEDLIQTRLYFVNTQTLAVSRSPFVMPITSRAENVVPPIMSVIAKYSQTMIKASEVIVNEYMLNLFGIVELQMQKFDGVNQGKGLMHSVFDNRPADQYPLSFRGVVASFADYQAFLDLFILKTFRYVGLFIGLDPAMTHWAHSGVLALVDLVTTLTFTALYTAHFLWDDIMLPYVKRTVWLQHYGQDYDSLRIFRNLVYESVQNGRLRGTVFVPQSMFCNRLPQVATSPDSSLSKLMFHTCKTAVEVQFSIVNIFATMLVFSDMNTCICSTKSLKLIDSCVQQLPSPLQNNYHAFWTSYAIRGGNVDFEVCSDGIDIFRSALLNMPNEALEHADRALAALASVPQELADYTGISTGSADACSDTSPGAPSASLTLTPQPISAFKRCGYTKTCQQKCNFDLLLFYSERTQAANPNVQVTGLYDRAIPTTVNAIQGMEEMEKFTPLLVETYAPFQSEPCDSVLVMLARKLALNDIALTTSRLVYNRICQRTLPDSAETTFKLLRSVELPGTEQFFFHSDFEDPDEILQNQQTRNQVIDILAPHAVDTSGIFEAVFLVVAWQQGMQNNGVYQISVEAYGGVNSRWILRSVLLGSSMPGSCDFRTQFVDSVDDESVKKEASVFIEPEQYVHSEDTVSNNPLLTHVSIVPFLTGTRWALLLRLRVNFKLYDGASDIVSKEYVVLWSANGDNVDECNAVEYDSFSSDGLNQLMSIKNAWDKSVAIEELPHECLQNQDTTCYQYALAVFQRSKTGSRNQMIKTSMVLTQSGNNSYSLQPLALHSHMDAVTLYGEIMQNYSNMTITTPRGGVAGLFPEPGSLSYYRESLSFNGIGNSVASSSCRARVLRIARPLDFRYVFAFYSLSCVADSTTSDSSWLQQQRIERALEADAPWRVTVDDKLRETSVVAMNVTCDYMDCTQCSGAELRRRCYAVQNCAIQKCIGTTFNHQNSFCVSGALVKEVVEFFLVDFKAGWFALVEFYINIFYLSQTRSQATTIDVEALSNYFVSKFCEGKDITALLSSFIPAIISTVYTAMRVRILKSTSVSENDLRFISPQSQLYIRTMSAHASEVLNAFLVGVPLYIFNMQKLILCAADQLGELSAGLINFVDNDIGGESTNLCNVDLSVGNKVKLPSDQEIITQNMLKDFGGQVLRTDIQRRNNDISIIFVKLLQAGGITRLLKTSQYKKFVYANSINTFIDYVVGILFSVSRFVSVFDNGECRPRPSKLEFMAQCVCADDVYEISPAAGSDGLDRVGLWCSGVLEMYDNAGNIRYVNNPYSFAELRRKLDGPDSGLLHYLKCVSRDEESCENIMPGRGDPVFEKWLSIGVSPLAVLTRCRENFSGRTWDSGIFAVYNLRIQTRVLKDTSRNLNQAQLDSIRTILDDKLDVQTQLCLFEGPAKGPVARCMFMYFENRAGLQGRFDLDYSGYFSYVHLGAGQQPSQGHDACGYLSTADFENNDRFGGDIRACDKEGAPLCDGSVSAPRCPLLFSTRTILSSSVSNVVETFSTNRSTKETQIQESYAAIQSCSTSTFESYLSAIENDEITNSLDFQLDTSEGDEFHQQMDCILMGAFDSIDYMPSDSLYNLTNLLYSRHRSGDSRHFELPCDAKTLHSKANTHQVEVTTCGTPARISAMAFVRENLQNSAGLNLAIKDAIRTKIQEFKDLFDDKENYKCLHECCSEYGADCHPADVDFSASFAKQISTVVELNDIIQRNDILQDIQYEALTNHEVSFGAKHCKHSLCILRFVGETLL